MTNIVVDGIKYTPANGEGSIKIIILCGAGVWSAGLSGTAAIASSMMQPLSGSGGPQEASAKSLRAAPRI